MYGTLGFDLLTELKNAAVAKAQEVKSQVLTAGGKLIASTPEGQAGIKSELLARAGQTATSFGPYLIPAVLILGVIFLSRRSR